MFANLLSPLPLCPSALYPADSSISVSRDHSSSLGAGLRCGFLGFLHMEVFNARLKDEFDTEVVMTTPSVPYEIHFDDGRPVNKISCVSQWPEVRGRWCVS